MIEVPKNELAPYSTEEDLRTLLDWAEYGPGQHNFLRIITDNLSLEIKNLLEVHGYEIRDFSNAVSDDSRTEIAQLLIYAQSYMNKSPSRGKIAVVVDHGTQKTWREDSNFQNIWYTNSQYMETFDF